MRLPGTPGTSGALTKGERPCTAESSVRHHAAPSRVPLVLGPLLPPPLPTAIPGSRPSSASPSHQWGAGAWPHVHTWIPAPGRALFSAPSPRHNEASVSWGHMFSALLQRRASKTHPYLSTRASVPQAQGLSPWAHRHLRAGPALPNLLETTANAIFSKEALCIALPAQMASLTPIKTLVFMLCQGAWSGGV